MRSKNSTHTHTRTHTHDDVTLTSHWSEFIKKTTTTTTTTITLLFNDKMRFELLKIGQTTQRCSRCRSKGGCALNSKAAVPLRPLCIPPPVLAHRASTKNVPTAHHQSSESKYSGAPKSCVIQGPWTCSELRRTSWRIVVTRVKMSLAANTHTLLKVTATQGNHWCIADSAPGARTTRLVRCPLYCVSWYCV